jgi:ABC-2 type transport system ATP-binding protein
VHELVIEARGLTKRFGQVLALDHLDLEVSRATCLGIVGESGAGKSVAMRLLAGLARPTSGEVTLAGVLVGSRRGLAARSKLGVLDQEPSLYDWMTGRELLAFTADLLGIGRSEAPIRIDATLDRVGLADAADRQIDDYPLSMRQRLGLAQALVGDPDVLLLDEPLGWLDASGRDEMLALLRGLRGTLTMVIATGDLGLAEATCDSVVVLDGGRALMRASIAELLERVASFVYVIEVEPGSGVALDGLVARLARERWVRRATLSGGILRVAIADEDRARRELFPAVVATGLPIVAVRRERTDVPALVGQLRDAVQ